MDTKKLIGSLARTAGAVGAGALIAHGMPPEVAATIVDPATEALKQALVYVVPPLIDHTVQFTVGVATYVGVQIWSIFEKKKR